MTGAEEYTSSDVRRGGK